MKTPKVLVKNPMLVIHDGAYYLINNDDDLAKVALTILEERLDNGSYGYAEENEIDALDYTREDIKNLSPKLKELALHELVKHEQWKSSFKEDNKYFKKASSFVENKDGRGAWMFLLKEQDDGCGEYIDLIEFDKVAP